MKDLPNVCRIRWPLTVLRMMIHTAFDFEFGQSPSSRVSRVFGRLTRVGVPSELLCLPTSFNFQLADERCIERPWWRTGWHLFLKAQTLMRENRIIVTTSLSHHQPRQRATTTTNDKTSTLVARIVASRAPKIGCRLDNHVCFLMGKQW